MNRLKRQSVCERILAIETSSPRLSLALGGSTGVLKSYQGPLQWRHAECLFSGMERLLRQVRWTVQSLTGVVVSTGPGSFTGIRIGLAAARAMGQALEIPVTGVTSLETLAGGSLKPGRYVCPAINALRGEVFTALYQEDPTGKTKTLWKECRLPLDIWLQKLKPWAEAELWFVGDGVTLYQSELKAIAGKRWRFVAAAQGYPQAGVLLRLGKERMRRGKGSTYQQVLPVYLRSAAARERLKVHD